MQVAKGYVKSVFIDKSADKFETMVSCSKCGTFVHESLVIHKFNKSFCSKECVNS
jgi:formylmethanofuran dehydrogenase subunit E